MTLIGLILSLNHYSYQQGDEKYIFSYLSYFVFNVDPYKIFFIYKSFYRFEVKKSGFVHYPINLQDLLDS